MGGLSPMLTLLLLGPAAIATAAAAVLKTKHVETAAAADICRVGTRRPWVCGGAAAAQILPV
jgi:hypothetical protein